MHSRASRFAVLTSLLLGAAIAVPASAQTDPALLAAMRKSGEAKAAVAAAPPWASISPNGEGQGYLIDVTNMALKAMGAPQVVPVLTTWDAMIPGLQARRFDMVPAGLVITEARCKAVAFSAPVSAQQDALYVMPGNPKKLAGYSGVAQTADAKLAVLTGSFQESFALKQGVKQDQLVRVPDIQAGIATVTSGRANAFAVGQFSVANPEQRGVERVVDRESPVSSLAIAFRKEDTAFRDAFNVQLAKMRTSGALKELYSSKYSFPNYDVLAKVEKPSDLVPGCE